MHLLHDLLAQIIRRMAFPEKKMNWIGCSLSSSISASTINVPQDQVRPLVGSKPPGKADQQRLRIQGILQFRDRRFRLLVPLAYFTSRVRA